MTDKYILIYTDKYILIYFFCVNTYTLYTETPRPNTNRHVMHTNVCTVRESNPVDGEYSHHYAKSAVKIIT
jgi:hypothetical protein